MKKLIISELFVYLFFLAFVHIESPEIVAAFILLTGALVYYGKKHFAVAAELEELYLNNMATAGMIAAVLAATIPLAVMGDGYWLQVLNFAMLHAIMALGLNLMTGRAGLICLGYAAFMAIGAYTVGILTLKMQVSFWIALPLAGLFASLFGIILGLPALRVKGHYLALVTIAFGLIIQKTLL